MPITLLDGILIGVTLFSAILAMVRGFSREVLSVASWVAAAVAAYYFYPYLDDHLLEYTGNNAQLAMAASAGIIFLVALIVVSVLTMRIADFVIDSRIGALDRTLGFLFGAARGILLVAVAMIFLNFLAPGPKQPAWVSEAKSKPLLDSIGEQLKSALPEDADTLIIDRLKGLGGEEAGSDQESLVRDPDNTHRS